MGSLTYGCISSNVEEKEYPVAADQFFYHEGINFVYLDGGYVKLALTATATLLGHAHVPAGYGNQTTSAAYWKSGASDGDDKILVTTDPAAKYLLPADDTPAITDNDLLCDIVAVNDGTATTVDIGTSSTDVLKIVDYNGAKYGGATNSVVVRINPLKFQGDT